MSPQLAMVYGDHRAVHVFIDFVMFKKFISDKILNDIFNRLYFGKLCIYFDSEHFQLLHVPSLSTIFRLELIFKVV